MKKLHYTNEMVIKDFPVFYGEVPPTIYKHYEDYKKGLFYANPYTLKDRFNGYTNFLKACGYTTTERINIYNKKRGMICKNREEKRKKLITYSKKQVEKILYDTFWDYDFVDRSTIKKLFNEGVLPFGEGVIKGKFKSLSNAFKEIGLYHLITSRKHHYLTKKEMIDMFKNVFIDKKNPPLQLEVDNKNKNGLLFFNVSNIVAKFGSYSKFLIEAEYTYNKGKYSQKYISQDGFICDSKSELHIDEFLHENNIEHKHQIKYKEFVDGITHASKVDFVLSDGTIVEYFGLIGQPKYDKKVKKKVNILEKNNINYIAIYPKDLKDLKVIFRDYLGGEDL